LVKKALPHFSLNTGFEFKDAVLKGQRQCFLQSVLLASFLQEAGIPAGVAMVNENESGEQTNNKHAVCIARLANDHDLVIDASAPEPFVRQKGLFLECTNGYRFLRPDYEPDSSIASFQAYRFPTAYAVDQIQPLDLEFIRSQFEYYRGERTVGGVMAKAKRPGGMELARRFLSRSVYLCPGNPLSAYMLGRVLQWQGHGREAGKALRKAMSDYLEAGWVPPDEQEAYAMTSRENL
jgi:hypothetical protein